MKSYLSLKSAGDGDLIKNGEVRHRERKGRENVNQNYSECIISRV